MNSEKTFRYRVVDVFTERALEGNPLANGVERIEIGGHVTPVATASMCLALAGNAS